MNQHPENHPPPPGPGLRLAGDTAREVAALRRQLAEANAYIADLEGDRAHMRAWCAAQRQHLREHPLDYGYGPEFNRGVYAGGMAVLTALWEQIKPAE